MGLRLNLALTSAGNVFSSFAAESFSTDSACAIPTGGARSEVCSLLLDVDPLGAIMGAGVVVADPGRATAPGTAPGALETVLGAELGTAWVPSVFFLW